MEEEEEFNKKRENHLNLCQGESLKINSANEVNFNVIKKTTSHENIFEGWEHFDSVKDSNKDNSLKSNNMFQSVESDRN